MVKDDKYSDKEFESEEEMYLYWAENHMDELTSHEKEKVKKAKRKRELNKNQDIQQKKQMAGWALAGVLALTVVGFMASQMYPSFAGPDGEEVEDVQELDELLEDRPVLGADNANVTIVEFGDYLCPACQQFEFDTKEPLKEDGYFEDGDVNFYYLHFPVVDQVGSTNAAVAAECVAEQDNEQFWDYTTALFQEQQQINYDTDGLTELAEANTEDLDYDSLRTCISDQENVETVNTHQSFGESQGVRGTPTVYINGNQVTDWSYQNIKELIDAEIERQS